MTKGLYILANEYSEVLMCAINITQSELFTFSYVEVVRLELDPVLTTLAFED